MSCLSCVAVADTPNTKKGGKVNKQGTKVTSTNDKGIYVEEKETNTAGKLKLKIGSLAYAWKKVRVVVEDKHILIYDKKKGKPASMFPLHLCNVRPLSNRKFRVLCAPNKSAEFRAKDNKQMREWVTIIQDGIARQLSTQSETSKQNSGMDILENLRNASEANRFCADCHAPDPKWVSVNIGCIICIECSGVHRQLGVTVSKVRSFELDNWADKNEVDKIGNADVNNMFEAKVGRNKPAPNTSREEREKYIYNKYVCKLYRKPSGVIQPILGTSTQPARKKSVCVPVCPQVTTPNQKRFHIGSDVFSPDISQIPHIKTPMSRRPSILPAAPTGNGRRGSYAGGVTLSPKTQEIQRKVSQRRFSLFQPAN